MPQRQLDECIDHDPRRLRGKPVADWSWVPCPRLCVGMIAFRYTWPRKAVAMAPRRDPLSSHVPSARFAALGRPAAEAKSLRRRSRDHPPSGPHTRLTSRNHPCNPERKTTRASGTLPTRRNSRATGLTGSPKTGPSRHPQPPNEDHERFRLMARQSTSSTRFTAERLPVPSLTAPLCATTRISLPRRDRM